MIIRSARHLVKMEIWKFMIQWIKLIIGPFDIEPMEKAEKICKLPERVLLKYFSTSPDQEPEEFVDNLRNTFRFMTPKTVWDVFRGFKTDGVYQAGRWVVEIRWLKINSSKLWDLITLLDFKIRSFEFNKNLV